MLCHYYQEQMANTSSRLQGLNHHNHRQMSSRGPYKMEHLGTALCFACRSLLGSCRGGCAEHCIHVFIVTCRCSSDDRTAPSTSTATGPHTRKDSATCLANSGLVSERLILNSLKLLV